MIITHGKRLTALEVENGKLEKMLAEQTIAVSLLKEMSYPPNFGH
jgi:hypothetical protein